MTFRENDMAVRNALDGANPRSESSAVSIDPLDAGHPVVVVNVQPNPRRHTTGPVEQAVDPDADDSLPNNGPRQRFPVRCRCCSQYAFFKQRVRRLRPPDDGQRENQQNDENSLHQGNCTTTSFEFPLTPQTPRLNTRT